METDPLPGVVTLPILLLALQGVIFLCVAYVVSHRDLRGPSRLANRLFAMWWLIAAVTVFGGAAVALFQRLWGPDFALQVAYTYILVIFVIVGLWALSSYLAFIFTGSPKSWFVLALLYAPALAGLFYLIAYAHPVDVIVGRGGAELVYENSLAGVPAVTAVVMVLFLPPILGALGYFGLIFGDVTRMQRFRVALVSGSLVLWFGSTVVAALAGWNQWHQWPLMARLIGILAALLILLSYRPPPWLERRLTP